MELPTQADLNELWGKLSHEAGRLGREAGKMGRETNINDMWHALTRANHRSADHEWLGRISLFGAGLMVGAGLALLLSVRAEAQADEHETLAEDLH